VFLSSHILSDVERTCDHIVILRQGSVALSESMDALRRRSDEWEIEVLKWTPAVLEAVGHAEIRDQKNGTVLVRCTAAEKNNLLRRLLDADVDLGAVRRHGFTGRSLHEIRRRNFHWINFLPSCSRHSKKRCVAAPFIWFLLLALLVIVMIGSEMFFMRMARQAGEAQMIVQIGKLLHEDDHQASGILLRFPSMFLGAIVCRLRFRPEHLCT